METNMETIELARDADGHALLSHEQAVALARWAVGPARRTGEAADDGALALLFALTDNDLPHQHLVPRDALARYVLASADERERAAGVVAAAGRQAKAEAELRREDAIGSPWSQAAARRRRNDAYDATESAVRAAGLAGDE